MQPIQNPTFDLTEGLYYSKGHGLICIRHQSPYGRMYRRIDTDTLLYKYTYFSVFNASSIFAKYLIPLVLEPIPDNVIISTIYPELFI